MRCPACPRTARRRRSATAASTGHDLVELLNHEDDAGNRWLDDLHVIGQVTLRGPIERSITPVDPPSTVRGSAGCIGGTVYFPRPSWPSMAGFRQRHPWSEAVRVESLSDVPAVVAATPPPRSTAGWTTCGRGHRHWGTAGAAGLLIVGISSAGPTLLLQKRAAWTDHGGTWGIPGGALEPGESPQWGALREAGEELGLNVDDLRIDRSQVLVDDHGGWSYTTVLAVPRQRLDLRLSAESTEAAWIPVDQLAELELHPGFAAWEADG